MKTINLSSSKAASFYQSYISLVSQYLILIGALATRINESNHVSTLILNFKKQKFCYSPEKMDHSRRLIACN